MHPHASPAGVRPAARAQSCSTLRTLNGTRRRVRAFIRLSAA